tara:strand:+ start:13431 stop:13652 length:222 start_codon:yes stop_codon:yes gene_type:complete
MNDTRFFYYSTRCRRHRELARRAKTKWAAQSHARLADSYGERAAKAMNYEFWLGADANALLKSDENVAGIDIK